MNKRALAILPLALLLGQCDRTLNQLLPKEAAAAPSPYAFNLKLAVTPEAAELMKKRDSHFVAAALYFGRPKPGSRLDAGAQGRLRLGYELVGVAKGANRIHLPAAEIETSRLDSINGEPHVMVTIYSATESGARDSLVRCKTYFGIISSARARPPTVPCYVNKP